MGVIGHGPSVPADEDGDEETWERVTLAPLMATLLLPILIGAILVIKCVFGHCCVRKTTTNREEMYGVEGRMTMLINSDAGYLTPPLTIVNSGNETPMRQTPSAPLILPEPNKTEESKMQINNNNPDVAIVITPTTNEPSNANPLLSNNCSTEFSPMHLRSEYEPVADTLKRGTGKRQLPEIPMPSLGHLPRRSSSVLSNDGTSELYATVGDVPNSINPYAHLKSRHSVPNDSFSSSQPSSSRGSGGGRETSGNKASGSHKIGNEPNPSSDSETYASSNHPYAKLKRNSSEHPYARVRNISVGNDEETDTDNYDLPQPYAQTRGRPSSGTTSTNNAPLPPTNGSSDSSGPVPPRRIGRQWRRGSHPQGQTSVESHFSGDSQDSRGYTSISVREPLSNIRNQTATVGIRTDSHYATVSDDSEEMYAAIDDSSEGNYMQIPEGERPVRPSWLDAQNVASPIPERREANSPLPPVPAVPPPLDGGAIITVQPSISPALAPLPQTPPVYAQVIKKTKKNKAPVTPTTSNASTTSQTPGRGEHVEPAEASLPGPSTASTSHHHSNHSHSHHHQHHHRSKSRTLMDNTNLLESDISEHRRWSKADISYSEFEVVREPLVPTSPEINTPVTLRITNDRSHAPLSSRDSVVSRHSIHMELVDEDNYNVIPDKKTNQPNNPKSMDVASQRESRRERMDSDNYQMIDPISNNTYQEIGGGKPPSDHYQEIGGNHHCNTFEDEQDSGSGFYQEIRKPEYEEEEEEEEDEDQFYEKVKSNKSSTASALSVPSHSSSGRKHGYEKIKRKPIPKVTSVKTPASDDEDEEEEDEEGRADEDLMYEKVKYPPYERLKESRSDLTVDGLGDEEEGSSNLYEHIGYSRVKPKHNKSHQAATTKSPNAAAGESRTKPEETDVDLNQLYAVVDKTKKKSKSSGLGSNSSATITTTTTNNNNSQNHNNNNPIQIVDSVESNLSSSSTTLTTTSPYNTTRFVFTSRSGNIVTNKTSPGNFSLHAGPDLEFIDDNNDIEYI